jgi:hypothetical protein
MDRHFRCYRANNGDTTVLSSCPCTCHDPYDIGTGPRIADWTAHYGHPCESWINAWFALESSQVDIYWRTGRPAVERPTAEQLALIGEPVGKLERDWERWHRLTGREPSW